MIRVQLNSHRVKRWRRALSDDSTRRAESVKRRAAVARSDGTVELHSPLLGAEEVDEAAFSPAVVNPRAMFTFDFRDLPEVLTLDDKRRLKPSCVVDGLVPSHAYTVLDVREVVFPESAGTQKRITLRMLKVKEAVVGSFCVLAALSFSPTLLLPYSLSVFEQLRNPHGYISDHEKAWIWDWSPKSPLWCACEQESEEVALGPGRGYPLQTQHAQFPPRTAVASTTPGELASA
jgi:hypothetical protein